MRTEKRGKRLEGPRQAIYDICRGLDKGTIKGKMRKLHIQNRISKGSKIPNSLWTSYVDCPQASLDMPLDCLNDKVTIQERTEA